MSNGLVYIFTGDGKGKTSASLGVAMRAVGNGMKVAIVQWYKDPSWRISEHALESMLTHKAQSRFHMYPMGKGFYLKNHKIAPLSNGQVVVDKVEAEDHRQAALDALTQAQQLLGQVDVLVCDEINNAVADGLLTTQAVIDLIEARGSTHLILTGRNAPKEIIEVADLVSEIKKIKHPYDQGKLAVKGLDF